jgi:hypothetical protein
MTAVVVAIISAVAATVGPLLLAWYMKRDLKSRVGTPNGNGNIVEMSEMLLLLMDQHTKLDDERFRELNEKLDALD